MRDEPPKNFQKVSCLCGAEVRVDPMSQNRRVVCRGCGNTFDFVVTMDASHKKSRLSLILPRGALKPEGETLANAPGAPVEPEPPAPVEPSPPRAVTRVSKRVSGKTIRIPMATCECGATFPLEDNGELTTLQSCPQCNRTYHVVFKIERGTKLKSAIIVPQKPIVHRGEKVRTIAAPKAPKEPAPSSKPAGGTVVPAGKGRTRVAPRASRPPAPPPVPAGAQAVACSCGHYFVVRRKDVGSEASCEGCGRRVRFEEAVDPQTLAPRIRIKSR